MGIDKMFYKCLFCEFQGDTVEELREHSGKCIRHPLYPLPIASRTPSQLEIVEKKLDKKYISQWCKEIGEWGVRKGFGNPPGENLLVIIPEKLMLIVSEISEAMECYRDLDTRDKEVGEYWVKTPTEIGGKPEGFGVELADAVIRIFHLCYMYGIDIEEMMRVKMEYNEGRSYKHGRFCQ